MSFVRVNLITLITNRFSDSPVGHGRVTGILSMVGMGVGCFALIIALSIINGFESIVKSKLKDFNGDLRLSGFINDLEIENLRKIPGVISVMPYMERKGLISNNKDYRVVSLKAVDMNKFDDFYALNLNGGIPSEDGILIGKDLAYRLGKDIGDEIEISSPIDQSFILGFPPKKKAKIDGIFSTRILDYDDKFVFVPLKIGYSLFNRKSKLDGFDVRLSPNIDIEAWKNINIANLPNEISLQTWQDLNRSLVDAMKLERLATVIILSLIFLVAAFNLAASLSLISILKVKETGILRIMGAPTKLVRKILLIMGLTKGIKGALLGVIIGIVVVFFQSITGIIPIPSDIYFTSSLPMIIYTKDVIIICFIAIFFIFISSLIASQKVAHIKPKDALQWVK